MSFWGQDLLFAAAGLNGSYGPEVLVRAGMLEVSKGLRAVYRSAATPI